MTPIRTIRSSVIVLDADDVDTDQIIPARFLTTTAKQGLGRHLFHDWRYDGRGELRPRFVLNRPASQGRQVLLAGRNFGCGSSREHAPWALVDWGLRAVIAVSFADIFRNNALKNGLVPVALPPDVHRALHSCLQDEPEAEVEIDVAHRRVRLPGGGCISFELEPFAQRCLLEGLDQLGYLLRFSGEIAAHEQASDPSTPEARS